MEIQKIQDNLTMDSLEIAELTWKLHKNVLRDIDNMLDELEIDKLKFELPYLSQSINPSRKYALTKDLTLTLISWYSIKLRKAIIDRWQELENFNNKPKTFEEVMRDALLLADTRVKELEQKVIEMKPKVDFAEAVWRAEDWILVRDFCKVLNDKWIKIWQNNLFKWLKENGYLMKDNRPYQNYTKYFPVKERIVNTVNWDRVCLTSYINWKWQEYFFQKLKQVFQIA